MFKVDSLSYSYNGKKVLDGLCMTIESGRFYGIIGPNGCGKTTFIDLLSGIKNPISGNIAYKGKQLSSYSKKELSREIAIVPQNFYINFPFTTQQIVMMGRYPNIPRFAAPSSLDIKIVDRIMERTGIYELRDNFVTQLSGGERQRVVFARALAQDTPVLIMDEATSNLDINHTLNLFQMVSKDVLERKKTIICVLHDINLATAYCDELIFMKNGKIFSHGATDEVLKQENFNAVFDIEAKIYFESYLNAKQVAFKLKS